MVDIFDIINQFYLVCGKDDMLKQALWQREQNKKYLLDYVRT